MAKFSGFFQSSKTRNTVIILSGIFLIIIFVGLYMFRQGKVPVEGKAKIATPPQQIQSQPGEKNVSTEYLKALLQSDKLASEQAIKKGSSDIPSLVATGETSASSSTTTKNQSDFCDKVQQCYVNNTMGLLNAYVKAGEMQQLTASQINQLRDAGVSVDQFADELNKLVNAGKLTPEQAKALLDAYKTEQAASSGLSSNDLVNTMLAQGNVNSVVAGQLRKLIHEKAPVSTYADTLNRLGQAGQLTSDQVNQLSAAYKKEQGAVAEQTQQPAAQEIVPTGSTDALLHQLLSQGKLSQTAANILKELSDNNVPANQFASKLNGLIEGGELSPIVAQQLLKAYRAEHGDISVTTKNVPKSFIQAQEQQQERALREQEAEMQRQAMQAQAKLAATQAADTQKTLKELQSAMNSQAKKLVSAWNPRPQHFVYESTGKTKGASDNASKVTGEEGSNKQGSTQYPVVQVGDIMFAVLDTGVNSDRPQPVMATIVSGKLKGAKLLGGLSVTSDHERVVLKFNLLTLPQWPSAVRINAFAINPDTAHTAIASDVDHHYLSRYGALFAANFIKGYANAVESSGQTTTTNSGTTTTNNPNLSAKEKLFVGLGEVGKALSNATKKYFDRNPTVTVDAGVGIGILFMEPVEQPS
ncbi:MAG: TrbI/VirB10 family protein [Pseudomonadota bacterium]